MHEPINVFVSHLQMSMSCLNLCNTLMCIKVGLFFALFCISILTEVKEFLSRSTSSILDNISIYQISG